MKQPIKRGRVMTEINITPFTDVVLVLLIIFMITTPLLMNSSIKIKLPRAGSVEAVPSDKNITIKITADGGLFLNDKAINSSGLERELVARLANNPDLVVVLNADRQIAYKEVISVLDMTKKAGVKKLALGVEHKNADH